MSSSIRSFAMTNTTKTLEAVKKEAIGKLWEVVPFSEESKSLEYLVMDIAEASYFAALDACRDLIPASRKESFEDHCETCHERRPIVHQHCTAYLSDKSVGFNQAREEALSAIDSIRPVGGKETV